MKNFYQAGIALFIAIAGILSTQAYDFKYQGIYYTILEDGETVEVTNETWGNYSGSIIVPETVINETNNESESESEVGSRSQNNFTVVGIGQYAFSGCYELESVTLPNTLTYIDEYAFNQCYVLEEIDIPLSVKSIGYGAFCSCKSLQSIIIPKGVTMIDNYTFEGCESLQEVELPESIENIEDYAFLDCISMISIELPENVRKISSKVFLGCSYLSRITVNSKNPYLSSKDGFVTNKSGKELLIFPPGKANGNVTLPAGIEKISDGAFLGTNLESVILPETLEEIGEAAFGACENLTNIVFPASLKVIKTEAFDMCISLKKVVFPKNSQLIHIYGEGFENCYNLEYVDLPASLLEIDEGAFEDCVELKTIICRALTPPSLDSEAFNYGGDGFNPYTYATVYVPEESVDVYKSANVWRKFTNINAIVEEAEKIVLNKEEVTITEGKSFQLTATVLPEDAKDKTVSWVSDNEDVAVVSADGKIKGIKKGYALITASCGKVSASCIVTVKAKPSKVNIIEGDRGTIMMIVGETLQLGINVEPVDADTDDILWESSDPEVVSVDQNGLVTALSEGGASITISYEDLSASVWIKVIENDGIESIFENRDTVITIYSQDGLIIKKDCLIDQLKTLPKGIYIIISGKDRYKILI